MNNLSKYIDRYPAKMVGRLAGVLIDKYTQNCTHLFDPFCGSSAILTTGKNKGLNVSGADINPYAVLLSDVKLVGFDGKLANELCKQFISKAKRTTKRFEVDWQKIKYWFSPPTLNKFERLRFVAKEMNLNSSKEGRAVLLAVALSVRLCSWADQRSPKYFISQTARQNRVGKDFNPFKEIPLLMNKLIEFYGNETNQQTCVSIMNIAKPDNNSLEENNFSHVITSPPYINAQDYFRNFKLEIYILEGLLPFKAKNLVGQFIGTEYVELQQNINNEHINYLNEVIPSFNQIKSNHPKLGVVVTKYFYDMSCSFDIIKHSLKPGGVLVVVCGDNLVAGNTIPTCHILNSLLEKKGFEMFDKFSDQIYQRILAPKRNGHKGLIKEEVISAFRVKKTN